METQLDEVLIRNGVANPQQISLASNEIKE